jgi:hypothetical protein
MTGKPPWEGRLPRNSAIQKKDKQSRFLNCSALQCKKRQKRLPRNSANKKKKTKKVFSCFATAIPRMCCKLTDDKHAAPAMLSYKKNTKEVVFAIWVQYGVKITTNASPAIPPKNEKKEQKLFP